MQLVRCGAVWTASSPSLNMRQPGVTAWLAIMWSIPSMADGQGSALGSGSIPDAATFFSYVSSLRLAPYMGAFLLLDFVIYLELQK